MQAIVSLKAYIWLCVPEDILFLYVLLYKLPSFLKTHLPAIGFPSTYAPLCLLWKTKVTFRLQECLGWVLFPLWWSLDTSYWALKRPLSSLHTSNESKTTAVSSQWCNFCCWTSIKGQTQKYDILNWHFLAILNYKWRAVFECKNIITVFFVRAHKVSWIYKHMWFVKQLSVHCIFLNTWINTMGAVALWKGQEAWVLSQPNLKFPLDF